MKKSLLLLGGAVSLSLLSPAPWALAQSVDATGDVNPAFPGTAPTWSLGGTSLSIGKSGTGTLTITNGGQVDNYWGYLGELAGGDGTATVSGPGSTWTNLGDMRVGDRGTGSLSITNGGAVTSDNGYIATFTNSSGNVNVSGSGSTWHNSGSLYVGYEGEAFLTIAEGAKVTVGTQQAGGNHTGAVWLSRYGTSTSEIVIGAASGQAATQAGTLDAGSLQFGATSGVLTFNHTDIDHHFNPAMSGAGTIRHLAGTTRLTGNSGAFSGSTTVSGGQLLLESGAALGGAIDVTAGTLGGTGTFGTPGRAVTIGTGATLAPGTLSITGDLALNAGSTYAVNISASNGDRTNVAGVATIASGTTMRVTSLDAATSYQASQTYTVLSATGGISGNFSQLTSASTFLNLSTSISGQDLILTVAVNQGSSFAGAAQTDNERSVAGALGTLAQSGPSLGLYNSILPMSTDDARATYRQIGGVTHASTPSMLGSGAQAMNGLVNNRMRGQSTNPGEAANARGTSPLGYAPEDKNPAEDRFGSITTASTQAFDHGRFGLWASGFGSSGTVDGHQGTSASDIASGGAMIGGDAMLGEWRLGLYGGYSRASASTATETTRGDNYHLGLYGGRDFGAISFRSGIGYTHTAMDSTRAVTTLGQTLTADYDAGTVNAFGELGYTFKADDITLEPFANLAHVHVRTDGFNETGGSAALSVSGRTTDTTFTTLGMRAASDIDLGGTDAMVRGMLGWQHAFGDTDPASTARFATGDAFTVTGTPTDRDALVIEAGLDVSLAPDTMLGIGYNGRFGRHAREHTGTARIRMAF